MTESKFRYVRIVINFADGDKLDTKIEANEGSFNFRVQPDCPAITDITISAPDSKVEWL